MSNESNHMTLDHAAQVADQAAEEAKNAAQRGVAAVRNGSHQLLDRAQQASDDTAAYVRGEPVKSLLIAAAAGAVLMGLVSLVTRQRS